MELTGPIFGPAERGPSRREFWYAAYFAALRRLPADEAVSEADRALFVCNERWKQAPVISGPRYRDDYPVGDSVALGPEESR